jgi:hypothetical protein
MGYLNHDFHLPPQHIGGYSRGMADGQIVRFKIGDGFPADDRLARWMTVCAMALNDLLLVNRWLVPRLEEKTPSDPSENFYLGRLAAAHLFEIAVFLKQSDRIPKVQKFVAGLNEEARADYEALIKLATDGSDEFQKQLKHARNTFFHYPRLIPQAEDREHLKRAMAAHAQDEREQDIQRGVIRDIPPAITGFRSSFADDIATEMMLPDDTEQEFGPFIGNVSEHSGKFLKFVKTALNDYTHLHPGAWEIEDVRSGEGNPS